jgi:hypothetical protein
MWCWRRMENISLTGRVNNEAVLHRVKEERNSLHTIRRRKANWIGHILHRNCLLSHIIEGKIIGTRRRGRRRKQLLDDLKEARRYWKLEEAQDRTLWRTQFGRGCGPFIRQTATWLVLHRCLCVEKKLFCLFVTAIIQLCELCLFVLQSGQNVTGINLRPRQNQCHSHQGSMRADMFTGVSCCCTACTT